MGGVFGRVDEGVTFTGKKKRGGSYPHGSTKGLEEAPSNPSSPKSFRASRECDLLRSDVSFWNYDDRGRESLESKKKRMT